MEFELKTLSPEAVPRALAKAERYRLLNEPARPRASASTRSQIDPDNQEALVTLLLALTDQFERRSSTSVAEAWTTRRAACATSTSARYYSGIIHERRAKAQSAPGRARVRPARLRVAARGDDAGTKGPRRSARRATTMRCCDGTPARGSSCAIAIWCRPTEERGEPLLLE